MLTLRGDGLHRHRLSAVVVVIRRSTVRWPSESTARRRCETTSTTATVVSTRMIRSTTSAAAAAVVLRRLIEAESLRQRIVLAEGRTEYVAYTASAAIVTVARHVRTALDVVRLLRLHLVTAIVGLHLN